MSSSAPRRRGGVDLFDQLKEHHSKGFGHLSEALQIDEAQPQLEEKLKALGLYKRGVTEMSRGLALKLEGLEPPERRDRALDLRKKMIRNRELALERVAKLESLCDSGACSAAAVRKPTARSSPSFSKPPPKRLPPAGSSAPRLGPARPHSPRALPGRAESPKAPAPSVARVPSRGRVDGASPAGTPTRKNSLKDQVKAKGGAKGLDTKTANAILDQVIEPDDIPLRFRDVAGQESAKRALKEAVVLPALNPEMFTGLRAPVRGLLLYGPPGNGKTMLAKAVAGEAHCTFFSISASSLTSKWVGEAEKAVKALFALAREVQPSIVFIDELDSILCERSDKENESSRRLKTEFLLQFDGVGTSESDRVLVMGATNRPFDLDEAVLRRFPKRVLVDLPGAETRRAVLAHLLAKQGHPLRPQDVATVARLTDGYSGADLTALAKEAAMGPVRDHSVDTLARLRSHQLRPINLQDFQQAMGRIRASTRPEALGRLYHFDRAFGEQQAR